MSMAATTCKKPARPEWVENTPAECTYALTTFDDDGGSVQMIDLTPAEFLELVRPARQPVAI